MELLLWRHAEAEDGADDLPRRLTSRGEKQAAAMAAWIRAHQPRDLRILVSHAARAQLTAKALDMPYETVRSIGPEAGVSDLIAATGWPDASGSVLVVAHQPGLGRLASLLLSGSEANWSVKKGGLWWLSNRLRRGETQTVLRVMMTPDFLD